MSMGATSSTAAPTELKGAEERSIDAVATAPIDLRRELPFELPWTCRRDTDSADPTDFTRSNIGSILLVLAGAEDLRYARATRRCVERQR
jgi:hypothetical protein